MQIRTALTFRASSIGDALNAKYLLENIHASYPDARCVLIVASRGGMIRDLLAAYPWIEVIEANRKNFVALWRLWVNFRNSDLVVTPPVKPGGTFSLPSKLAARLLARSGGLFGFADASRNTKYIYDHILQYDPHRAPRFIEQDILTSAGIPITVYSMRLSYIPQPNLLARFSLEQVKYLVLHLFAGSETRAMSQKKRQELIDELATALPETPLVITGTKADKPYIEQLVLPATARVVAGELTLQELSTLISSSTCVVSIGTGPSHMTSHLEKPLIVLVICNGIPWCGSDQFDIAAAEHIYSVTDSCGGLHDKGGEPPLCIENIDMHLVAQSAQAYFKQ